MSEDLSLDQPTQIWVLVNLDRNGNPRGFEKSTERFYLTFEDAAKALSEMRDLNEFFVIREAIIGYP